MSHGIHERADAVLAGRYVLRRVVAVGGMGTLFAATDKISGSTVAVKLLRSDQADAARSPRLLREAQTAAQMAHPNVVSVYDVGLTDDLQPFFVMELLSGLSLAELLSRDGRLSVERAFEFALPIMGAVATAHDARIIHRDLKPANVFLCKRPDGTFWPKLLDFGVAKVLDASVETRSGVVLGTPLYMSPEQVSGNPTGPASDVWSMGVMLYECIGGARPFEAGDSIAVAMKIMHERPARLSTHCPDVPPAVEAAIHRALERQLSQRYATMRDFARDILAACLIEGIDIPVEPDPIGLPAWSRWREDGLPLAVATLDSLPLGSDSGERPAERRRSSTWGRWAIAVVMLTIEAVGFGVSKRLDWSADAVGQPSDTSDPGAASGSGSTFYICVENQTAADIVVAGLDDVGANYNAVLAASQQAIWKKRAPRASPRGLSVLLDAVSFRTRYKWTWIPYEKLNKDTACQYNRWIASSSPRGPSLKYSVYRTETPKGNPMVPKKVSAIGTPER